MKTKSKNISLAILLIGILVTLSACEKEIRLDLGGYTPKIVMNGIISPDSLIEIKVSKSFLYTDTLSDNSLLKNASLTLFINGQEREKMRMVRVDTIHGHDRLGFHYTGLLSVFRSTVRPKTGDRIRIEASAGEFNSVWAEATIPVPPEINRIDTATFFTSKKIINDNSDDYYGYYPGYDYYSGYPENISVEELYRNMRIKMAITGTSDASQYFLLRIRMMSEKIGDHPDLPGHYLYLYTDDDPVFEESHKNSLLEDLITEGGYVEKYFDSALFSNKLFRNNKYTLDFSITDYYYIHTIYEEKEDKTGWGYFPAYTPLKTEVFNPPLEVQFTVISPELYPYYRQGEYDPHSDEESIKLISEPEITFSNVHNGIGIVGAVSGTKVQIDLPPFPGGENRVPRRN